MIVFIILNFHAYFVVLLCKYIYEIYHFKARTWLCIFMWMVLISIFVVGYSKQIKDGKEANSINFIVRVQNGS